MPLQAQVLDVRLEIGRDSAMLIDVPQSDDVGFLYRFQRPILFVPENFGHIEILVSQQYFWMLFSFVIYSVLLRHLSSEPNVDDRQLLANEGFVFCLVRESSTVLTDRSSRVDFFLVLWDALFSKTNASIFDR